ncbi:tumor necrosis factor receptor superfamily member 9-like [Carassius carassius]|uniref:tumor necrosis factor receptor superfamily member 9-like n=1 Tax=Carassius carassius TaxID=217509 RepID=UPI0028695896|nr:tumor necrosis factor receptor superfamily member 9-like [Carassius carassius]
MIFYMKVLSTLLCILLLHQNASAFCPAGQRENYMTKKCEACPNTQYRSTGGTYFYCENCSKCIKYSIELNSCTSTSDTKCKCKKGFTPIDWKGSIKEEICFCKKGSGIYEKGICKKCEDGFFTDKEDSICQKWRECVSGIGIPGTSTSDVVCKNASIEVTKTPKTHTTPFQTTTISSTSTSRTTDSSSNNTQENSFYSLWLVMLCSGILLLAGVLYHKCKVSHCIHNHKKMDFRKESVCRKPVEESGEKCHSMLV